MFDDATTGMIETRRREQVMQQQYTELSFKNRLIRALPPEEVRLLRPMLTRVRLTQGQIIYESGERIDQLYFIEEGLISMAPPHPNAKDQIEVDSVGREGVVGVAAVLNPEAASFNRTIVRIPGIAYRIVARSARDSLSRMPGLRRLLIEELEIAGARLSQNTACRSKHSLTERLARWLVMARDLANTESLVVTQDLLATMLAVRRPGVTVALARLEQNGLVKHRRGNVLVCDRDALAAVACDCDVRLRNYSMSIIAGRTTSFTAAVVQHC